MRSLANILILVLIFATSPTVPSNAALARSPDPTVTGPAWATSEYRLTRIERDPADLVARTRAVLALFSPAEPDGDRLEQWAEQALDKPHRTLQVHPLPDTAPGVVVLIHPWDDDLTVMDVQQLRNIPVLDYESEPVVPDRGIGQVKAHRTMQDTLATLEGSGVLSHGYSPASARLGIWREHESRGPGRIAEWVVEYQFTMNRVVDGLEVIDAGVRIGIHRDGGVSSIRVTDVEIESVPTSHSLVATIPEARESFVAAEHSTFPEASVIIERERLGVLLGPQQRTVLSAPCMIFNYSLRFEDSSRPAVLSRQKIATVSLFSGTFSQIYPVPTTSE